MKITFWENQLFIVANIYKKSNNIILTIVYDIQYNGIKEVMKWMNQF